MSLHLKSRRKFKSEFAEFLFNQIPIYDRKILKDIRPSDGWLGTPCLPEWAPRWMSLDTALAMQEFNDCWNVCISKEWEPRFPKHESAQNPYLLPISNKCKRFITNYALEIEKKLSA